MPVPPAAVQLLAVVHDSAVTTVMPDIFVTVLQAPLVSVTANPSVLVELGIVKPPAVQ
jgi:hypothetical protein